MPQKTIGSAEDAAQRTRPDLRPDAQQSTTRRQHELSHDDGVTNPRDGRGPLRPRDDQAAKLPLRPPH